MGTVNIALSATLLLAVMLAVALLLRGIRVANRAGQNEQIIGHAMDAMRDGFIQLDQDQRILKVNSTACDLFEQSRQAMLKRSIFAFIGWGTVPDLAETATPKTNEIDLTVPSGKTFRCQITHSALTDRGGRPTGAVLLLTDLTGRAQQEAYLRRAAAVFEQTAEGVMIMDAEGRLTMVNTAFTKITGFNQKDVLGKTPQCFRYGHIWTDLLTTGHWQGEIVCHHNNGEAHPEWLTINAVRGADGVVQSYIGLFSDVSHLKKSEEELKHMAHYDALTDLPNRTLMSIQLNLALERAGRRSGKLAVFALDLDGFKTVNDSLGHPAGDLLLQKIASRLRLTLRGEDVVARMGGDEFAMIIENPPSAVHIGHLAKKIIAAVSQPVDLDGSNALVTASIGIAIFPRDGGDAIALLKAADTAMYASKQGGRNTYRYHDSEMAKAAHQRMEMEQGLIQAMERHQLELYYQPQVNIRSGEVLGVEALVRWNHPEQGTVLPAAFIPVAEETGLILPLGEWVLREACRQAQSWARERLFTGTVAVNVAGQQIQRGDFSNTVKRVLLETGLDPRRLVLEITESILLHNAKQAMAELGQLRALGISIAIDDFGVGHSSLAHLKDLNAQTIKIDQRFVRSLPGDKNDAAITSAIVAMGRSMGFDLIAEGVETEAQQIFLEGLDCLLAQGFLYAKPLRAGELADWLRGKQLCLCQDAAAPDHLPFGKHAADGDREGAQGPLLSHPRWSGDSAYKH